MAVLILTWSCTLLVQNRNWRISSNGILSDNLLLKFGKSSSRMSMQTIAKKVTCERCRMHFDRVLLVLIFYDIGCFHSSI